MTERTGNGWQTPDHILERVRRVGPIVLDPASYRDNPTNAHFIRTESCNPDGLQTDWAALVARRTHLGPKGITFVNPPYGRGLMDSWSKKILEEARKGCQVVALLRGDTSTAWSHALLWEATSVCFPPRIRFKGATGSPNFTNVVYYFGVNAWRFWDAFNELGPVIQGKR